MLSLLLLISTLVALLPASPALAAREPYRAASPEYGLSVFLYDQPATTARDLASVQGLGFGWIKALFRWVDIEHDYKGAYTWAESDRVVQAARARAVGAYGTSSRTTPWTLTATGILRAALSDTYPYRSASWA